MTRPLVSIILPVYNAASTVERAVESIRAQSLDNWELIVIDDGSTDDTSALLARIASRDGRVRLLAQSHAGLVSALNRALHEVRGAFIARMDADDASHPDRLSQQARFLENHSEIGLVGCQVEFGGSRLHAGGYALYVDWINSLVEPGEIELNRFVESPFAHPSVMFRRKLLDLFGAYQQGEYPEDYELWLRWLDAGVRMAKVRAVLLKWNDSPQRLSRNDPRYSLDAFYRCKALYLARWLRKRVDPARRLIVWGAGRPTRKRADHLGTHGLVVSAYIDVDVKKIGRVLSGRPVLSPDQIIDPGEGLVLCYVAKRGVRELARAHLRARGFVEGRDFLMMA